jgi:hypothetical protein
VRSAACIPGIQGHFDRFGVVCNHLEEREVGAIGHDATLFPVPQGANGQGKGLGKFGLGEPQSLVQGFEP